MLHVVKPNDTLHRIATLYGTTIESIMEKNVICNPNFIYVGQPLTIPEPNLFCQRLEGTPYYVVKHGDTLGCLAKHFSKSVESLAKANGLQNMNQINPGMELLVTYGEYYGEESTPEELFESWNRVNFSSYDRYFYYIMNTGTFTWEAFGEKAVPYLAELVQHSNRRCPLLCCHESWKDRNWKRNIYGFAESLNG